MNNILDQLQFGSVVRLWHGTRGHDYVVCGVDRTTDELMLLKNNCINKDGSVHKATKRIHKTIPMIKLRKDSYAISRISVIMGLRTGLDKKELRQFIETVRSNNKIRTLKPKYEYIASPRILNGTMIQFV